MASDHAEFAELALPHGSLTNDAYVLRVQVVAEAVEWAKGDSPTSQISHVVYESGPYAVALRKPGKEAPWTYKGCRHKDGTPTNNPNDMTPRIMVNGEPYPYLATFEDVFEDIQHIGRADALALELVGCLFFRAALMLDYLRNEEGNLRWSPAERVMRNIGERIPTIHELPSDVWLHSVIALSLNENVKYDTLGYDIKQGYGGQNTLLTCAHIVAVFLDRASLAKFAGNFARPPRGVSPLPKTKGPEFFPMLKPRRGCTGG